MYRTSDWKSDGIIKYQATATNQFGSEISIRNTHIDCLINLIPILLSGAISLTSGKFTATEGGIYRFTFTSRFRTPSGKSEKLLHSIKKFIASKSNLHTYIGHG